MRNQSGVTSAELLFFAVIMLCAGGWIANLAKFFGMLGGDVSAMFIARIVGIFVAPLGSVLGFF